MATEKTRGRPAITVLLPRRKKFTIFDVVQINKGRCSAPTVRSFIDIAISEERIEIIGAKRTGSRGRPAFLLSLA
jgi:hypothetical protein